MTVTYPNKRAMRAWWGAINDADCAWLAANGWDGVAMWWDSGHSDNVTDMEPYFELIDSYGLKVWVELDEVMGATNFTISTAKSTYGTTVPVGSASQTLAQLVTMWEADDRIAGYIFENSFDNGVDWLRSNTTKTICCAWLSGYGYSNGTTWSNSSGANWFSKSSGNATGWRLSNIDEILWETFNPDESSACATTYKYLRSNFPNLKLGIMSGVYSPCSWNWWQTYAYYNAHKNDNPPPASLTLAQQEAAETTSFATIRNSGGLLDFAGQFDSGSANTASISTQCEFFDSLGMLNQESSGFQTYVGTLTSPTSTGSQFVSVGFTPKAVIFWANARTVSGWSPDAGMAYGYAANNTAKSAIQSGYIAAAGHTGVTTTVEYRRMGTAAIGVMKYDNTIYAEATLSSFNAEGFTLNWGTVYSSGFLFNFLALGGDALTNAAVLKWQGNNATGVQGVTLAGFKPDCVMHLTTGDSTAPAHTASTQSFNVGAMDKDGNQWVVEAFAASGATTTSTRRAQITTHCLRDVYTGDTGSFSSMDTDGFSINWGNANTFYYMSLLLKGGVYKVGNFAKSTTAAPVTNTVAFALGLPSAVLTATDSYTDSSQENSNRICLGGSDGTTNGVVGETDKHGVATSVAYRYTYTDSAIIVSNNDTETSEAKGAIRNFVTGSFDVDWSVNNPVATKIAYIAFGMTEVDVTVPAVTASAEITANTSDISVTVPTLTPTPTPLSANTSTIDVTLPSFTAYAQMTANVYDINVLQWNTSFYTVTLPAGENVNIGPFDTDIYSPKVRLTHSYITGVTIAVLPSGSPVYNPATSPYRYTIDGSTYFHVINSGASTDYITVQPIYCVGF